MPCDTCNTILGCFKLYDLSINREAEGLEKEGHIGIEFSLALFLIASIR